MHTFIVINQRGDSRHSFDPTDAAAVAEAQARFNDLLAKGYRAASLDTKGGPNSLISAFDKNLEQTLFIPQFEGG